jgi:zinc protease
VLDNGLQVRVVEMHTAPLVSVWCWYRVGSKDERPGLTGVSHWVEHMNFKGTTGIPPDDFKQFIDRFGGFWNGYTWIDQTTYMATATKDALDEMLFMEAERMDRCLYDAEATESERSVIVSDDDEVTSAKRYLVGSIPRSLETNAGIARFLQTTEQFGLGLDHDRTLPGLVDAVADAARRTLRPEQAAIVIAGPYEES